MSFDVLGLSPELSLALRDMAFETPSPIQSQAIPLLLAGQDMIGQAQTGTGKTAAFAIPIIERIDPQNKFIQALVMCPTRELAIQVAEAFRKLMKYKPGLAVVSIYGGQPIDKQLKALKKRPQIIVGTPGRLTDHLRRGSIRLDAVQTVVLDEADEMLDMGFRDDIESILGQVPAPRQTVMFSATMPKSILELTRKYLVNPEWVRIEPEPLDTSRIHQEYVEVSSKSRLNALTGLIDTHQLNLALVFCNTQRQVDELTDNLKEEGYLAGGLHGGMSQEKRDRVMGRFRKGTIQFLVATDVAARGIDVQNVQAVFNYDIPDRPESYMHRIGRTGRAGKTGLAFTFVSASQLEKLNRSSLDGIQSLHLPREGQKKRPKSSGGGGFFGRKSSGKFSRPGQKPKPRKKTFA